MEFQCPLCRQRLHFHEESRGWHCDGKHHFDKREIGYWDFYKGNKPRNAESRQELRARQFLVTSGLFQPAVESMVKVLQTQDSASERNCVNLGPGHAWIGKLLAQALTEHEIPLKVFSPLESENEAFAAAKSGMEAVCLTPLKSLPFADASADMLWLLDIPAKGKEWQRILKPGGLLLMLAAGPRHLWQIKEFVYDGLTEKPFVLELSGQFELISETPVSWTHALSVADAKVLMGMAPWAWRVKEASLKAMEKGDFSGLEMDYRIILAKKRE